MRKLVYFTAFFTVAVCLSVYLLSSAASAAGCIVFALLSFGFVFFSGTNRKRYFLACLGLSFGFLYFLIYTAVFITPAANLAGISETVTATVRSYPETSGNYVSADVVISVPNAPDIPAVMSWGTSTADGLTPGDVISAEVTFDEAYNGALAASGNLINAYADKISIESTGHYDLKSIGAVAAHRVKEIIDQIFPSDTAPFAKALITGDRNDLYKNGPLYSAIQSSGLAHIVAVSGMHIAFVMSVLSVFVKSRRKLSVFGIPLIIFFMAFTGFSPSVCRAGIMYICILSSNFFMREADALTSLFTALLLLLIANPYSVSSISLQLSFLASLGIILLSGRIYRSLSGKSASLPRAIGKILRFIISITSITISALIFTVPLTALYFGYVSLVAPVAALLVMGILSLTFTLCTLSCAVGFIWLFGGTLTAGAASLFLRFISQAAFWLSDIPLSAVHTSNIWIILWLVCTYLMFIAAIIIKLPLRRYVLPCCLSVIALCCACVLPRIFVSSDALCMTAVDVGQGQCIILTCGGKTAVIDCGSTSDQNAGKTACDYLRSQGIYKVDTLILTHYHADHTNGADEIISDIGVSSLILLQQDDNTQNDDRLISLAGQFGAEIIFADRDIKIDLAGAEINIYPPISGKGENESCLSVLSSFENFDILVTGDMPAYCEMLLIDTYKLPDIEVLIAGHHGAETSTCAQLLNEVKPEAVVISVGKNNYGHPSDKLLLRLSEFGAAVFRTDISGNITISSKSSNT